jgi:hypothetical protein
MHPPAAVIPDYLGANLARVVPALLSSSPEPPRWLPQAVIGADQVVLLVVDGLGWLQLSERLRMLDNLAALEGQPITTVVPSTTAAALTSLVVGAPPALHGVVGYKVVVEGPGGPEVMNVLRWRTATGDARSYVDPVGFQLCAPFGGADVPVVSKADFVGTGFTLAHQRDARQVGWHQVSGMAVEVKHLVERGEKFVYAYYDGVDRIAHMKGFGEHYDAELIALDRVVGDLLDVLPPSAALVVTADHGQVSVGPNLVEVDPASISGVAFTSGEARFRWFHTSDSTPAAADRLSATLKSRFGHQGWVATLEEVTAQGWLGGDVNRVIRSRMGDVALAAFEPVAFVEPGDSPESRKLVCRHGSMTPAEMFVPLVGGRGRL